MLDCGGTHTTIASSPKLKNRLGQ